MPSRSAHYLTLLRYAVRLIVDHIPRHLPVTMARKLTTQAANARDAGLYEMAGALFEEALKFTPNSFRLHVQSGHMFKEAQDFARAEKHYAEALRLQPRNPGLFLQLGHFYKVVNRIEDAASAYETALQLRPGWAEAANELARLGVSNNDAFANEAILSELLPRGEKSSPPSSDRFHIARLGAGRIRTKSGIFKVLRGVEAIRGYYISTLAIDAIEILIDGDLFAREPLSASVWKEDIGKYRKFVFNIWNDYGSLQEGVHDITLRFMANTSKVRVHRERIFVASPLTDQQAPHSDTIVTSHTSNGLSLVERINNDPSIVRSAARSPLPGNIKSILIQRVDQLGDLACSIPAINRIREIFPEARLIGLLSEANVSLGRATELFDEIVIAEFVETIAERRRTMVVAAQQRLRETLQPYAFDLAIDLCEGSDSRPLLLLSGARFLCGFEDRDWPWLSLGFKLGARDPYNRLETTPPSRKMVALVEAIGTLARNPEPLSGIAPDANLLARYGLSTNRAFLVIHTGARLSYSRWPGFPSLIKLLLEKTALDIVVFADDEQQAAGLPIAKRVRLVVGRIPFDDLDALISGCDVFVGNDSGPKHLAALRGVKVVSLHMARLNWNEWGQEFSGSIISRRVPCAGCAISYDAEDCGKDFACIRNIKPEEVLDAVISLLG